MLGAQAPRIAVLPPDLGLQESKRSLTDMEITALFNELGSDPGSSSRREDGSGGSRAVVLEGKDADAHGEQKAGGDVVASDGVMRVLAKDEPVIDASKSV